MSYNRPHYLQRELETLGENDLTDTDIHLWQDGALDEDAESAVEKSVQVFEGADLPRKTVHRNESNMCCAAMRLQVMPWMANHYEQFICMDNDILLSPFALHHMRTLFEQYRDDERIGSISLGFRTITLPTHEYRDKVCSAAGHFWCEGWWTDKWRTLWCWYRKYYECISDVPYRNLEQRSAEVANWAQSIGSSILEPSSDTALLRCIEMENFIRIRFVVNRARGIGEHGLHSNNVVWASLDLGNQPLHTWPDEVDITQFELVPTPSP